MKTPASNLDTRFATFSALGESARPPKGWLRAIRDALGMTSAQFARRLGIAQPSAVELEQSEALGRITLRTLERAAEALGCRVVYALIPEKPLAETVHDRASLIADRQAKAVEHTMRLEDQAVPGKKAHDETRRRLIEELMRRPARLWDEP